MAGAQLGLEQQGLATRGRRPQLGDPLGRLVVGHARVVQTGRHEHRRVVDRGDVLVRRVGGDGRLERRVARVAPLLPLGDRERERGVEHRGDDVDEGHLGHHRGGQVRPHGHRRAHQQATGAPAPDGHLAGRGDALGDEVLGTGQEVGEGVDLVEELPVEVPAPAQLAAAPRVGQGPHHASVEQGQPGDREPGRQGVLVGAVAVEHRRRRRIDGGVPPPNDVDGARGRRRAPWPTSAPRRSRQAR